MKLTLQISAFFCASILIAPVAEASNNCRADCIDRKLNGSPDVVVPTDPVKEFAREIGDAMKNVGPAYMCGSSHEFREALDSLRQSLLNAGVPDALAGYAIDGVSGYARKEFASKRETITAVECAERYHR